MLQGTQTGWRRRTMRESAYNKLGYSHYCSRNTRKVPKITNAQPGWLRQLQDTVKWIGSKNSWPMAYRKWVSYAESWSPSARHCGWRRSAGLENVLDLSTAAGFSKTWKNGILLGKAPGSAGSVLRIPPRSAHAGYLNTNWH